LCYCRLFVGFIAINACMWMDESPCVHGFDVLPQLVASILACLIP
jgi:hypothetical protein